MCFMQKWITGSGEDKIKPAFDSPSLERVIRQLRIRARLLKASGIVVLIMIVALLFRGFWVFSHAEVSASDIEAKKTKEFDDELAKAKTQQQEAESVYNQAEVSYANYIQPGINEDKSQQDRLKTLYEKQATLKVSDPDYKDQTLRLEALIAEAKNLIKRNADSRSIDGWSNTLAVAKKNKMDAEEQVKTLEVRRNYMIASGNNTTVFLGTLLSTKIGTTVLLLFLVQILVTLYRYSIRLAAFYDSRADILQLLPSNDFAALDLIASVLSADRVEFGKIAPPTKQMLDFAKEVIAVMNKDQRKPGPT